MYQVLAAIDNLLRRLPKSTTKWTCRWFLTILYVSVFLFAIGLTVIPGTLGIVATYVAVFTAAYAIGQRG